MLIPLAIDDKSAVTTSLVSLLAPACILNVPSVFNNAFPLNLVSSAILVISSFNCVNSPFILLLSSSDNVSLPACTPNSLILWAMFPASSKAPSAVWTIDIPSCTFLSACSIPLIWALIFSETANPAASSPALVILKPVDNFSIEFPANAVFFVIWFVAIIAFKFVFILICVLSLVFFDILVILF